MYLPLVTVRGGWVSVRGGVSVQGGLSGGVCRGGVVSVQVGLSGGGSLSGRGSLSVSVPVNRITDACENITLIKYKCQVNTKVNVNEFALCIHNIHSNNSDINLSSYNFFKLYIKNNYLLKTITVLW